LLLTFIYNHGYERGIGDTLYLICILLPKMRKSSGNAYPPRASEFICGDMVVSVLLIFLVFGVVLLCVFTFWVPCYDVRYDFRINQCSVCLFFQLFVGGSMSYVRCLMLCVMFLLCFSSSCVPYIGLSIVDWPFDIL
jgi:hypothetical protein